MVPSSLPPCSPLFTKSISQKKSSQDLCDNSEVQRGGRFELLLQKIEIEGDSW
ncbi:hypothetical protein STEG23_013212, partial [Scotinomys teguina]